MSDDTHTQEGASAPVFSASDIAVLQAARTLLHEASRRTPHTWAGGFAQASIKAGEDAIFEALNAANAYLHLQLTHRDLFGHDAPTPEVTPESLRAVTAEDYVA